jgi:hypothetical protein
MQCSSAAAISSLLVPNVLLSTLFSNTICALLLVWEKLPQHCTEKLRKRGYDADRHVSLHFFLFVLHFIANL